MRFSSKKTRTCYLLLYVSAVVLLGGCAFFEKQRVPIGGDATSVYPQSTPILEEQFNGTAIELTKWNVANEWDLNANGAVNNYCASSVIVTNGFVELWMKQTPCRGRAYAGGAVDSWQHSTYLYGYFEARIKCPKGSGLHCSWWLWPDDNGWPPEIDIMEISGNKPMQYKTNVHWPGPGAPPWGFMEEFTVTGYDFTADFHVYGLEWTPDHLVWFLDGREVYRTTEHVPQKPHRLQVDLALDAYAGGVDATTILPAVMLVDYVRVYAYDEPAPAAPADVTVR